jgi:hypothetical protein
MLSTSVEKQAPQRNTFMALEQAGPGGVRLDLPARGRWAHLSMA